VFAGAFRSASYGTGTVLLPPCALFGGMTHWEASKVTQ